VDGVEGARPGKIMDSIEGTFYDDIVVVPCAFTARYIEWAPRESGGGFKGEHLPLEVESGKIGEKFTDKAGNERLGVKSIDKDGVVTWNILRDTRTHFCMLVRDDGTFKPVVISMASTQIKKSRRWLAMMQAVQERTPAGSLFNPPSFSRMYQMFSVKEQNQKGNWNGWSIGALGPVKTRELYDACKAFNKLVMEGSVKAPHEDPSVVEEGDGERTGF
jgi:hypothetical protein